MYARWGTFAVGLGLVFAPLVLGYRSVAPILHDVIMGSLVCIATLAAFERPRARFVLFAPALWLIGFAPSASEHAATLAELVGGALLLVLAAIPGVRLAQRLPRVPGNGRARA